MKHFNKKLFPLLLTFFLFGGCGQDLSPVPKTVQAPIILRVNADADTVYIHDTVHLQCLAQDTQGDQIYYRWTTDHGSFATPSNQPSVIWNAPGMQETSTITVIASDGIYESDQSLTIETSRTYRNISPRISSVQLSTDSAIAGGVVVLACTAVDPDSDNLTYHWSSVAGSFTRLFSDSQVEWNAPRWPGEYILDLAVSDGRATAKRSLSVKVSNTIASAPPEKPELIFPEDGAENLGETTVLEWSCFDAGAVEPFYEIYFDANAATTLYAWKDQGTRLVVQNLKPRTTYRWRVVAIDNVGQTRSSRISSFTVGGSTIEQLKKIFPLAVGNSWTYHLTTSVTWFDYEDGYHTATNDTVTTALVSEEAIGMLPDPDQPAYYITGTPYGDAWYAYSDKGVVKQVEDQWVLYWPTYHYPLPTGFSIVNEGDDYSESEKVIMDADTTIEVEGTTYEHCYLYGEGVSNGTAHNSWGSNSQTALKLNIGLVRFRYSNWSDSYDIVNSSSGVYELQQATVQVTE